MTNQLLSRTSDPFASADEVFELSAVPVRKRRTQTGAAKPNAGKVDQDNEASMELWPTSGAAQRQRQKQLRARMRNPKGGWRTWSVLRLFGRSKAGNVTRTSLLAGAVLLASSSSRAANDGIPVNGLPNYQERAVLTLVNAVRMAPAQFRDTYLPAGNSGILNNAPTAPMYWNQQLTVAARNHAVDMATNNYFSHTSQNGTTWLQRIAAAGYTGSPTGENIAAGYNTPLDVMNGWLLSQGHRDNLMNTGANELGVGYAYNPGVGYQRYWVQDMGVRSFAITSPIASGSHVLLTTGSIRFLLNVDDPASTYSPPQSVTVVVNGAASAMNLHMGAADRGTYEKTMTAATSCRSYHFELVSAAGASWRFPATGEYRTNGEGGCTQDYQAAPAPILGDVNGNGIVNVDDLLAVISAWGACPAMPAPCPADIAPVTGGNHFVNVDDLLMVINHWN